MTVSFVNDGEIDIKAVKKMGLSHKKCDNPIGKFGTGLKYAIAIICRLNGVIKIYSGTNCYRFQKSAFTFDGQDGFEEIVMSKNGGPWAETPMMANYGLEWQPWQAMRELESNCRDAGGKSYPHLVEPEEGKTTITVKCKAIEDAYADLDKYFLNSTPIDDSMYLLDIHEKGRQHANSPIFYRGVYVGDMPKRSEFLYNFKSGLTISEDRMVHPYEISAMPVYMGRVIVKSTNRDYITRAITAETDSLEATATFDEGADYPCYKTFLEVVKDFVDQHEANRIIPKALRFYYEATGNHDLMYETYQLTTRETRMVKKSLALLKREFPNPPNVRYVVALPNDALGMVINRGVYISKRNFAMGLGTLTGTLFEEFAHQKFGYRDESRGFQQFLIDTVAKLLVEREDQT